VKEARQLRCWVIKPALCVLRTKKEASRKLTGFSVRECSGLIKCTSLYVHCRLNLCGKYFEKRIIICNSTDCSLATDIKANATNVMLQEVSHKIFKNCVFVKVISMGNDPNTKLIFS
jgi:hypothetical protein